MANLRHGALYAVMLVALLFLQYHLWFKSDGIGDMVRLKKMLAQQTMQNERLKKENDDLVAQIQGLQNNQEAAEARARGELGMVKKGETFYQVVK